MPVDYRAMIPTLSYRNQAFINGKYVAAASGKTFDCVSPIDGRVLTQVASCDAEDVNRAVTAARAVFEKGSWSTCHPAKRKKVMLKFAELIAKHKDELALLETLDMGKPISASAGGDIPGSIQAIQWYAEAADKVYDEVAPYRPDSVSLITRELAQQLQATLQALCGLQLVDLHISDLLNNQLPSHYDYTSQYDILVFRRLAAGQSDTDLAQPGELLHELPRRSGPPVLRRIDTSPVAFAVFDHVLLTVHPADCSVRDFFINDLIDYAPKDSAEMMERPFFSIANSGNCVRN